jgi:asparagine synthase (glutamine-hydrolysing)
MCGIAGLFCYASSASVDKDVLVRMRDTMIHRGPDGSGLWLSKDSRVGLAHRRLAIVDLSDAAAQPLCNEDLTVWTTFNGEIYNHLELRANLVKAGHIFRTDHSDTEVIVHGYEEWGIDGLVKAIEGDFALGLWDGRVRTMYLIRDRIGVKPLYFAVKNGILLFASEIKALLAHPAVRPAINMAAMQHYLTFLTTPAPLTMFEGIFKLPAGHYLKIDARGAISARRYWDALPGQSEYSGLHAEGNPNRMEAAVVADIRSRLSEAVRKRTMADVPYGVLLSGGIDSSTNVALMSTLSDRSVETFTVGFRDYPVLNETEHARQIAQMFRTNHHEILIDKRDMTGYIQDLVHTQDEPIADWVCIPLFFVSKLARDNGVVVTQVGEGSDEQFFGYRHYFKYAALNRFFWQPFWHLPELVRHGLSRGISLLADIFPRLELYADFVDRAARKRELFWSGATVYRDMDKRKLLQGKAVGPSTVPQVLADTGMFPEAILGTDTSGVVEALYKPYDSANLDADYLTRMIYGEFKLRLPELLLMRVDKITMSTSLEARVPYLDHRLVELTMDLPERLRVGSGTPKYLLKKAVEGLIPKSTIDRKKVGFDAPVSQWLREDFGQEAESRILNSWFVRDGFFRPEFVRGLFSQHRSGAERAALIWVLFNLTEWFNYWIE